MTPAQTKANRTYYKRNKVRVNIQTRMSELKRKFPDTFATDPRYLDLVELLNKRPNKRCKCGGRPYKKICVNCGEKFD